MRTFTHASIPRPILAGDFWLIGPAPDLRGPDLAPLPDPPECVDHHLFQDPGGTWHLWGCIRGTATGRILYHWEGERLVRGPWVKTGEIIRPDPAAGESLLEWGEQEWIQSPFVVREASRFYFFFGGHSTGLDRDGGEVQPGDPRVECQICLMTSVDGRIWERHRNEHAQSRLFSGPGEARDPCVLRLGDTWYLYYAGYESGFPLQPGIYLRTSTDLLNWSASKLVHRAHEFGSGRWTHECPHVVLRGDCFYLFRTENYDLARTHVFWSQDPADFGVDRPLEEHYLGLLPLAAPEVIVAEDGSELITSCHALQKGVQICRLNWTRS
jgi:hypothetical protein